MQDIANAHKNFGVIKDKAYEYIKFHQGTSFVELEKFMTANRFVDESYGNVTQALPNNENVILWATKNALVLAAYAALTEEKKIHVTGAGEMATLCYLIDGKALTLPIAKDPRKQYKTPHWAPITFSSTEGPTPEEVRDYMKRSIDQL